VAAVAAVRVAATELAAFAGEVAGCTKCRLAEGRTQVVFGVGDPSADLMFVGEAPGFHEDRLGQALRRPGGKLLDKLLGRIGLDRDQVYVANVLKCRPPATATRNRTRSRPANHLFRQISDRAEGRRHAQRFATKLLSGKPTGITPVHGAEQEATLGGRSVLYPLYHPPRRSIRRRC
jgi:DNA polymerase